MPGRGLSLGLGLGPAACVLQAPCSRNCCCQHGTHCDLLGADLCINLTKTRRRGQSEICWHVLLSKAADSATSEQLEKSQMGQGGEKWVEMAAPVLFHCLSAWIALPAALHGLLQPCPQDSSARNPCTTQHARLPPPAAALPAKLTCTRFLLQPLCATGLKHAPDCSSFPAFACKLTSAPGP